MAVDLEFIRFVTGQMQGAGQITYRLMFGGCTVYCEGKVVALICDDQLFIKPTQSGRAGRKQRREYQVHLRRIQGSMT